MRLSSILLPFHLSIFTRRLQTSEGSMAQINILIQKAGLMVLYFISTHYAAVILCQILLSCVCVCVCACAPFDTSPDWGISSCCLKLIKSSILEQRQHNTASLPSEILHHHIRHQPICPHLHKQVCAELLPSPAFRVTFRPKNGYCWWQ